MQRRILVACRDDKCRENLLKLFSSKGLMVHSVWQDADLLMEVLERDYDVVFYDLEISNLNGDAFKMIKILRRIRPKLSLIVISNDSSKEVGGKILQEGITYYALKPINLHAMTEALSMVLKQN
ncbi:response regulator [candidate division KSB1 bacterium]|nr:response regulator [candidate division KSB1 bacterium]NIR69333.1 response regulator [candidate division KSB1 bacterium]NIS24151.1 response regulator [candidate division KSB1 bacterium]NIT71066.1 response regulator [candidate division KSB1 bacterium]NIU24770.1 response regulator [candidate division KSB1 bacterium]